MIAVMESCVPGMERLVRLVSDGRAVIHLGAWWEFRSKEYWDR